MLRRALTAVELSLPPENLQNLTVPIHRGKERWSVKTGSDVLAATVSLTATAATVTALNAIARPSEFPADPHQSSPTLENHRVAPTETTVWTVPATIVKFKIETDGDYHVVITDGVKTMVAELPNPDPSFVNVSSAWAAQIADVRKRFRAKFGILAEPRMAGPSFTMVGNVQAQITGVGFFDFDHGQDGRADNILELHPVLDIEWV